MGQGTGTSRTRSTARPPRIVGRFRLLSLLGSGATGSVYRAEDTVLHRYVALKLFHPGDSPVERRRTEQFIREARSAARLEHPNIVRVHEINHVGGWYYIAMELVEGGTLLKMARALARDPARACQLLADAADGLAAAHAAGIVHRDVKPANLFVARDGRCKVGDFGMASLRDPGDGLTLSNEAAGTPMYAPPDVLTGAAATPASDIYSFACTAFHLLAGRPPFQSARREELLWMHVRARPESLHALRPDVPTVVSDLIMTALAKDPADRPADMVVVAQTLRLYGRGDATAEAADDVTPMADLTAALRRRGWQRPARPSTSPAGRVARWVRATLTIVAFGLAVVFLWLVRTPSVHAPQEEAKANQAATTSYAILAPEALPTTDTAFEEIAATAAGVEVVAQSESTPPVLPSAEADSPAEPSVAVPEIRWTGEAPHHVFAVTDAESIARTAAANDGLVYAVYGRVSECGTSSTGRVFQVYFDAQGDPPRFLAVYFPNLFRAMQEQHGGKNGAGLQGKLIAVRGRLSIYRELPQIVVESTADLVTIDP